MMVEQLVDQFLGSTDERVRSREDILRPFSERVRHNHGTSVRQSADRLSNWSVVEAAFVLGTPSAKHSLSMRKRRTPTHLLVLGSAGPS
jgi:hypothetical protein